MAQDTSHTSCPQVGTGQVNEVIEVNEPEKDSPTPPKAFTAIPFSALRDGSAFDQVFTEEGKPYWIKYSPGGAQCILDENEAGIPITLQSPEDVTLASGVGSLQSPEDLLGRITGMLKRVHQFSSDNEAIFLALYSLGTWTYDLFPHVGYAAISGNPGSNKSGLLFAVEQLVLGGLKVSGSATDAVIFRRLDQIRGTFIQDESQQEANSSSSRLHKILAEGNTFNGRVEIAVPVKNDDYKAKKYHAFGPKIFACREVHDDEAILSRTTELNLPVLAEAPCLEDYSQEKWRSDAVKLRNDLLLYRQRKRLGELRMPAIDYESHLGSLKLTGRERQVYLWLFGTAPTVESLRSLCSLISQQREKLTEDRMHLPETQILLVCLEFGAPVPFSRIAQAASRQGNLVTPRIVGKVLRRNHLTVSRRNAGPVLTASRAQIRQALARLGISLPPEGGS